MTYYIPSSATIARTLRHTYSSILKWHERKTAITLVIFSTIIPTSWRSWSIVMGFPIIEVKHVCSVTKFVATLKIHIPYVTWNSKFNAYEKKEMSYFIIEILLINPSTQIYTLWCFLGVATLVYIKFRYNTPDLGTYIFTYTRFRQNRLRYNMENRTIGWSYNSYGTIEHQKIQDKCT